MAELSWLAAWLLGAVLDTPPLEAAAVLLAVVYLLLAMRQDPRCWLAGGASAALFLWLFASAQVYLQAALQVVYVALAAYGWWRWRGGGSRAPPPVGRLPWRRQALLALATAAVATPAALVLGEATDSASPWLDASTSVASLAATWLTARKLLESWLWWIVIDVATAWLLWSQDLVLSALLFAAYAVLAAFGYRAWRRAGVAT